MPKECAGQIDVGKPLRIAVDNWDSPKGGHYTAPAIHSDSRLGGGGISGRRARVRMVASGAIHGIWERPHRKIRSALPFDNRHSRLRVGCPFCAAGSTGRRNTGVKSLCRCFKMQGLTWSFVELTSHFVQMGLIILRVLHADLPDYANAHGRVRTLLDELRSIDLDHPDTQKVIEDIKVILKSTGRPT